MPATVRIGNAHGFWGDRIEAAAEMLALDPDLDFVTLDFLAEVSMSILAAQRQRDPAAGYARDFLDVLGSLLPYWQSGGRCRIVTNAGGLNPLGCGQACQEVLARAGCGDRTIAIVSGDDVLELLHSDAQSRSHSESANNLDTGSTIDDVIDRLTTANAYLGAQPIAEALRRGADLVITGRVADPSLTVGPCIYHFGWDPADFDRIAGATVAGHLIECGTQVTGGISTDWLSLPNLNHIGFPVVEVDDDGGCLITKPIGSGGQVSESTVKEQLLYEIGDPGDYLSPDVRVSFLTLNVRQESADRVRVSGASGRPPTDFYKVSATYRNGFRAAGQLTIYGHHVLQKAQRAADLVISRLELAGVTFQNKVVETLGAGGCRHSADPMSDGQERSEVVLRIAVSDESRESVEQFARAMMPLITAGPAGTTGYAEGRPRVHPQIGYWPCLIRRSRVAWDVRLLQATVPTENKQTNESTLVRHSPPLVDARHDETRPLSIASSTLSEGTLSEIAYARSGDKGRHANIGVIARRPSDFLRLQSELTIQCVARHLGVPADRVTRYELPNLQALNFVIRGILANPLRIDAQGKTLAQFLLQLPLRTKEESGN